MAGEDGDDKITAHAVCATTRAQIASAQRTADHRDGLACQAVSVEQAGRLLLL